MKMKYIIPLLLIAAGGTWLLTANPTTPRPAEAAGQLERGKYLVLFGGCMDCHTPLKMTDHGPEPDLSRMLSGHPENLKLPPPDLKPGPWFAATAGMTAWAGPWGISYAANLTPDANTGLGIWTEDMFIQAMRTGKHMGSGRDILPPMPWRGLAGLSDDDLRAIFAYLRSIPPIANHVPDPVAPGTSPLAAKPHE
jgi:mono/diheme cytochrome c family protein